MKIFITLIIISLFSINLFPQDSSLRENHFPVLKGPYLGQNTPGDTAEIFARGIVSVKGRYEFAISFSSSGKEMLVGTQERDTSYIIYSRESRNGWTSPKRISLSNGKFINEMEAFFTPDGKYIYFAPFNEWDGIRLWKVDYTSGKWKNLQMLDPAVTSFPAFYPVCAKSNTLYYSNIYDRKIYRSRFQNGNYIPGEEAGFPFGFHCFIAPDESFALIDGGTNGIGRSDIYVVFRNTEGRWKEPINLGPRVNSGYNETCPSLSHDGKYIFFSRYNDINEVSDIYWISAKIIEELRQ